MNPSLRASDADRERAVGELERHAGAGRLTLAEFSERAAAAYRARTLGELAALRADLPTLSTATAATPSQPRFPARSLLTAIVLLILLGGLLLAATAPVVAQLVGGAGGMCH